VYKTAGKTSCRQRRKLPATLPVTPASTSTTPFRPRSTAEIPPNAEIRPRPCDRLVSAGSRQMSPPPPTTRCAAWSTDLRRATSQQPEVDGRHWKAAAQRGMAEVKRRR